MGISSILTINGTSFTASQRAGAHILPTGLSRTLDGGYDTFTFWEIPTSPFPSYVTGLPVSLAVDIGDGNGYVVRFQGVIDDCQSEHGQLGWGHAYTCQGLKFLTDRIPVTAVDGTGQQVYNRAPLDEYYNPSDAGLELGEIIRRILCVPAASQALNAIGIGNYTGLPSAPVLPSATLADLALLTVVPPRPVIFQGEGLLNAIDQEVSQWMPKWFSEIQPDGVIRFKDSTNLVDYFVPQTITCPSASAAGDPVTTPRVQRSTRNCATRLILRGGPQVEVAILSLEDGTLAEVFTSGDKAAWDLTYFTAPKGATDYGTVTATTSTSATLVSHDATATWTTNFWSNNNAVITLIDSLAAGISQFETRSVTSNNALSAGGSSTVNWDSTWPITSTSYDMYRITGGAGGLNGCWRDYSPREPSTGKTGLDTFVGAHLVTRSAIPVRVANAQQSFGAYFATATIVGGSLGQEFPLTVQPVPSEGIFRFAQPTVMVFGQTSDLNNGSPTDAAHGLPIDVVVYALYSRGALSVTVPPDVAGVPQYEGTAFTEDGVTVTKFLDFPNWLWINDTTSFGELAQQILDTMSNAEVDVDISWYLTPDGPVPAWDFLSFGYCLNIAIAGQSSPWSDLNAPVRSIGLKWDWTGRGSQAISFQASTRRRAFSGLDLYIHPEFAQGSPLSGAFQGTSGNFESFNNALAAGYRPQSITPGDIVASSGMPSSRYTLQDNLDAGKPTGGGIRDATTDPNRKTESVTTEGQQRAKDADAARILKRNETAERSSNEAEVNRRNREEYAAMERQAIKDRNAAKPAEREQAAQDRSRRAAVKESGNRIGRENVQRQTKMRERDAKEERGEINARNDAKQVAQWGHMIDVAMDKNFPDDPLDE